MQPLSLHPLTTFDPLSQPLLHSSLQSLHLTGSTVPVLAQLSLPALTSLRISGMDTRHFVILTQFLFRNYTRLTSGREGYSGSYLSYSSPFPSYSSSSFSYPGSGLETLQIGITIGPPVPLTRFIEAATQARVRNLDLYGPGHVRLGELVRGLTVPGGAIGGGGGVGVGAGVVRGDVEIGEGADSSDSGSVNETELVSDSGSSSDADADPASLPSSTSSSPSQTPWPPRLWGVETSGDGSVSPTRLSGCVDPLNRKGRVLSASASASVQVSATQKSTNLTRGRVWEEDIPMPDLEHLGIEFGFDADGEEDGRELGESEDVEEVMIDRVVRMVESRTRTNMKGGVNGIKEGEGCIYAPNSAYPCGDTPSLRLKTLKSLILYTHPSSSGRDSGSPYSSSSVFGRRFGTSRSSGSLYDRDPSRLEGELQKRLMVSGTGVGGRLDLKVKDGRRREAGMV
ncbi:hypothetical protein D9758_010454 [Tetrapyrgos nigripes]|uniref:Uncharacterized protein n=1 Tax=Tetrapyrgos nigripes TaxID=182062 RepID=A0A8H5CQ98_9AGAR|nr:hypothetical protein D9758_010454 [Tetrapyrgos nigripes]